MPSSVPFFSSRKRDYTSDHELFLDKLQPRSLMQPRWPPSRDSTEKKLLGNILVGFVYDANCNEYLKPRYSRTLNFYLPD